MVLVLFVSSEAAFRCDPEADCAAGKIGDLVPDPENCEKYYLCINSQGESVPSNSALTCPNGTYFDQTTAVCKTETGGTCNNVCNRICQTACKASLDQIPNPDNCSMYYVCIESGGDFIKADASCSIEPNLYFNGTGCSANVNDCCDVCVPYCFAPATQVQDPLDCHKYYLCTAANATPEEKYHFTCESGGFNPETGVCDESLSECLDYCTSAVNDYN